MLYPKNIEEKLGFDKIRLLLKEACCGTVGESYVDKIRFSFNYDLINKLTAQTDEFRKLLIEGTNIPENNFIDIHESLKSAEIEGAFLLEESFFEVKLSLSTLSKCLDFFNEKEEVDFPELKSLAKDIEFDKYILNAIEAVIDDRGKIKDNASPELSRIRRKITSQKSGLRKTLESVLKKIKGQGFAKEDANSTMREGRMVVPIISAHKRHVKGFVHDTSSTGQTVYIEPEEILNLNNEIRELEFAERQEIIRILTELTNKLRPYVPNLLRANLFLGMIDFIRAKAKFALDLEAIKPEFKNEAIIEWYHVFHPTLLFTYNQQGRKTIPQNIKLDNEQRILLISGPNAGGKSVTLKTIGLNQYMFQCGLLVPMTEASTMGVFKNIFMDFGDEQSLEDDLSTYSSHLTNMKYFLKNANRHTLCIIDEFGSGTEPQLGAAISESILQQLNKQKTYAGITTHYGNLKFFAERTPGIVNAAMRYDVENIKPLYKLDTGKPGSSFALEIAENIGLPKKIVDIARKKVGSKQVNIEKLLNDLEVEKRNLELNNQQLEKKEKELSETYQKYSELKELHEKNKKKLLNEAKQEAEKILAEANKRIEHTIKAIKEKKADKEATKQLRENLESFKEKVKPNKEKQVVNTKPEIKPIAGEIEVGDYVQIKGQQTIGEVVGINKKDIAVLIGELKSNIKLNRLQKISKRALKDLIKKGSSGTVRRKGIDINKKQAEFREKIDVRGKKAEEVLSIIDELMDNALMLGKVNLSILHGKGDGILRELIRKQLRNYKEVKSIQSEHADRGGEGITLVTLY